MEAAGFDGKLAGADLVVTGEGRIDAQTAFGKTALGVARRAAAAGVPCIAVGGGVTPEGIDALAAARRGRRARSSSGRRPSRRRWPPGTAPVERCGERIARLVTSAGCLAQHRGREPRPRRRPTRSAPKPQAPTRKPKPKRRKRAEAGSGRSRGRAASRATGRASSTTPSTR